MLVQIHAVFALPMLEATYIGTVKGFMVLQESEVSGSYTRTAIT